MKYVLCRHCMVLHRQHHGRHQESEAGGNVGARARAQCRAMEIGVWGLWAKCRPGLELPGVRGLNPQTPVHVMLIFE